MADEKKKEAYISVLGRPKETIEFEEGATVGDALASAGVTRVEGDILLIGEREVSETDALEEGETLYFVPPVQLG